MDIGLVVGSLGVGLIADNRPFVAGLAVDSLLVVVVDKPVDVAVAVDRMADDAVVAGIPIVDSLAMVIDTIDRDSWFGDSGDK